MSMIEAKLLLSESGTKCKTNSKNSTHHSNSFSMTLLFSNCFYCMLQASYPSFPFTKPLCRSLFIRQNFTNGKKKYSHKRITGNWHVSLGWLSSLTLFPSHWFGIYSKGGLWPCFGFVMRKNIIKEPLA